MLQNHPVAKTCNEGDSCCDSVRAPIPKVVHQIWIGPHPVPLKWIETWREQHTTAYPDWKHMLWRDDDILALLPPHLKRIYDKLDQLCLKADVARYVILEKFGGVYLDADLAWLGGPGLDTVTAAQAVVAAFEATPSSGWGLDERISNAVIGVPRNHPLMTHVLNSIVNDFLALEQFLGEDWSH